DRRNRHGCRRHQSPTPPLELSPSSPSSPLSTNVERGTLKDSFTVAGGDDPSSQQWEPTVPSRVAAKAAARLVPLKRQCCARLRAKAEGTGGEVDSAARPTTHSSGDSLTLAILVVTRPHPQSMRFATAPERQIGRDRPAQGTAAARRDHARHWDPGLRV